MITLYVDSDHATPAVMQRLRELADSCAATEPRFCGLTIEIEKGDSSYIDNQSGVDGYDVQPFFNDAQAIILGFQS